jgi:restriction endonuclease S subunit
MQSFVVYKEQLNKRLDAWSYRPAYCQVIDDLRDGKWPICNLIDVCKTIFCGPFGTAIKSSAYVSKGVPFIRITNIKSGYLDKSDLVYITPEDSRRLKSTQLNAGDLVISQRGTIGNVAQIPKEFPICNISANTIGVKMSEKVNAKYVLWFLISKFGKIQFENIISGHIQNKITTDDVKNIKIPLPPRQIQDKIAGIMDEAYKKQREMLDESKKILDSIESYLLKKLDIKIPSYKEEKKFIIRFDNLKGNRYDPFYYQQKYLESIKAIKRGKYQLVKLEKITKYCIKGIEVGSKMYCSDGIPFLRVENIEENRINLEVHPKCIAEKEFENLKEYQPQLGEILFTKDGTIGRAVKCINNMKTIISSGILRIAVKENVNTDYIVLILNSSIIKLEAERNAIGAVIKHLSIDEIKNLQIPLPPLSVQNQIANEINSRQEEAEKLRLEAERIIKETKEKVKKMILGG